ncbi:MAG: LD-carboxypeptidase [Chlorobium sp.]|jgi:muramoyltetrapeptide carboxypeptidase|uniref:S66 peptidase family protein n=1 Tax=Chlorobium sp. TaxID=1095 RepID=UPI001DDF6C0A|nr:LD-carboxypeptidase [Chlorobium sp.]MBN1278316.1 LD-carboxypeptidase [Chlorobiaceae bacterium]MCF8216878.1 LD-carboxypeptidase [Chlorobium sp.]MCF8271707.1 LD-carboxypeptidase [Chlorobium sp.]MCF8288095.1 LD-carboxypeptidase [Chlorobium sp.]MCF8291686.1 LD-carboxypeptidase [Chlorobium sp.]
MRTLVPKALRRGDIIGLISPSSHCAYPDRIELAVTYLEKCGYKVRPSDHLNRIDTDPTIADEEKLHDLHTMFSDSDVKAIVCLRGGAGASRLLKKIDYRLIAANPKILIGYSDITALSLAVFSQTGLISFSGPMLTTELHGPTPYTEEHFWGMLTSPLYAMSIHNHTGHHVTCIRKGVAEGRLIGGNLSVLSSMVGTPYLPPFEEVLLFLEDINEPAYRIDRMLSHLGNAGLLSDSRGILFGQFSHEPGENPDDARLEKIFNYYRAHTSEDVPVMRGLSYGHIRNLMTIPVGARFCMEVSESSFTLRTTEPVVAE